VCGVLNEITYSDFGKQGETIFTVSHGGKGKKKYFINLLLAEICQKRIIYIVFHQVLLQLSWRCAHAAFTLYYRCK